MMWRWPPTLRVILIKLPTAATSRVGDAQAEADAKAARDLETLTRALVDLLWASLDVRMSGGARPA